jgi:hypothetical protein
VANYSIYDNYAYPEGSHRSEQQFLMKNIIAHSADDSGLRLEAPEGILVVSYEAYPTYYYDQAWGTQTASTKLRASIMLRPNPNFPNGELYRLSKPQKESDSLF